MLRRHRKVLYKKALDTWGANSQILMVVEECSELVDAICKYSRDRSTKKDVLEEIADVSIMLEQLLMILDFSDEDLSSKRREKLYRLQQLYSDMEVE